MKKASFACALFLSIALLAFAEEERRLIGPDTLDRASSLWRDAIEQAGVKKAVAAEWVEIAKRNIAAKAGKKPIFSSGTSLFAGEKDDFARGDYFAVGIDTVPGEAEAKDSKATGTFVLYTAVYAKGSLLRVDLSGGKVIAFDSPGSRRFVLSIVDGKRNRDYVAAYKDGVYDGYELRLRNFDLVFTYDKQGRWPKSMVEAIPYYALGGPADKKDQRKYYYKSVMGGFELDSADGADRAFFTNTGCAIIEPGAFDPTRAMRQSADEEKQVPVVYTIAKPDDPRSARIVVMETTKIVRTAILDSSGGFVSTATFSSPLGIVQKVVTWKKDRPWQALSESDGVRYGEGAFKYRYASSENTEYYSDDQVTSSIAVVSEGVVRRRLPGAEGESETTLPDWKTTEIFKIAEGKVVIDPKAKKPLPAQIRYDCGSYTYIANGPDAGGILWDEGRGDWSLRNGRRTIVIDALLGSPSQYGVVPKEKSYRSQIDDISDGRIVESWLNWGVPDSAGGLLVTGTKHYSTEGADPAGPPTLLDAKGNWLNGTLSSTYPTRRLTVTMRGIANLEYDADRPGKIGKGCPLVKGTVTRIQVGEDRNLVEKGATVVRRQDSTKVETYGGCTLVESSTTIDDYVDGVKVSSRTTDDPL